MKRITKQILKKLLIEKLTGRDYNFEVQEDDKFIISYPRSGNTWMRFLLANILTEKVVSLVNIEDIIIDVYKRSNKEIRNNSNCLNIFKSHSFFRPKFSNNKVVYIVRDVRDVVISYWNWYRKNKDFDLDFEKFLNMFIKGKIDKYGNWGDNVGSWIGAKWHDKDDFLLIRYEDMIADIKKELIKVCDFFNIGVSKEKLEKTIKNSKFKNLKNIERMVENHSEATKNTSKEIKFFRKGTVGQWKTTLTQEQCFKIQDQFGGLMDILGYE